MKRSTSARLRGWLFGVAGTLAILVALVGVLHAKAARPILRALTGASCPLGLDKSTTPEERESMRAKALCRVLGDDATSVRPALGFELGASTRDEVVAWSEAHAVRCAPRGADAIACPEVSAGALDERAAVDVVFGFDPRERLISLNVARRGFDAGEASDFVRDRAEAIERDVGPATSVVGEASASYLASGRIAQASYEFAFSDYRARVSATQMRGLGLLVREQYQAILE